MAEHTAASPEAENIDSSSTPEVAQRARRRIARRLLPFLFVLYVIAFLDRMNIGAAALQMPGDLGFSERVIGLGAGIFFLGYFLLGIPGALIVERSSARRLIARIMISWGMVTVLVAFIHTARQFYLVRFLVGAAEAGFFPGVIVYLTQLVPLSGPGQGCGVFLRFQSSFLCHWFSARRFAAGPVVAWSEGLAMAVHHRGDSRNPVRRDHHLLSDGLAERG
jgi:MFS family permease